MMSQMATKIIKWVSLPVLLIASLFSRYAASYELLLDFVICLGAVISVQRAVRSKEYFWAAGFVVIAVVFSPLLLAVKVFLLMGLACIVTFLPVLAVFRTQRMLARRAVGIKETGDRLSRPGRQGHTPEGLGEVARQRAGSSPMPRAAPPAA